MGGIRWGGWQAVIDFRQRAKDRQERWKELEALARDGKVKEFYAKYAEYLKWDGCYSGSRKLLLDMALAVEKL